MQKIPANVPAAKVAEGSSQKAPEAIPIFLPQLIDALASLNIQVTSPYNQLTVEETDNSSATLKEVAIAEQPCGILASPIVPADNIKVPAEEAATTVSSGNGEDDKPTGFVCTHCSQHNVLRSSRETVYLVTVGRSVGVFTGWHNVQPLVSGVPHACYKKFSSKATATEAFKEALLAGTVVVV